MYPAKSRTKLRKELKDDSFFVSLGVYYIILWFTKKVSKDLSRSAAMLSLRGRKSFLFSWESTWPPSDNGLLIWKEVYGNWLALYFFDFSKMREIRKTNRPFPSCFEPHYESEAKCKVFVMKISFYSYANKTNFHMNSFAFSLACIVRFTATRQWSIHLIVPWKFLSI